MQPQRAQALENIRFKPEATENEVADRHSTCPYLPVEVGAEESRHVPANPRHFDDIANALKSSLEILIVGPSHQKLALTRSLIEHHLAMAEGIASAETVDHPSDDRLLAYARNYFVDQDFFRDVGRNVESNLSEKVDVSRVLIQRVEGMPLNARVSSLEAASAVLERWVSCTPDFGHDQCTFQIAFEDGFRYHGRYRLKASKRRVSLSTHVRKQLAALATITDKKEQEETSGESVISLIGANLAQAARITLDRYNI